MVSGTPPFMEATREDSHYRLIVANKFELFWKFHCKNKPGGAKFFSQEFKDLVQGIFQYDPEKRLTME
jgi:hypothetical protein